MTRQATGGVGERHSEVVAQALATTDQRVAVIDIASRRITAVSKPLADDFPDTDLTGQDATQFIVEDTSDALPLLAAGQVDGYELPRRLQLPDRVLDAYIWIHALGHHRPPRSAVVVIDTADPGAPLSPGPGATGTAIGTVDDEWRIDRISADVVGVLGASPDELRRVCILTLIHPGDLAEFLTGLGQAQRAGAGVGIRVRGRRADGRWVWLRAKVSPLGLRPAFAFALGPLHGDWTDEDRPDALERSLTRIVSEVHTARAVGRAGALPALAHLPELTALTTREWEVVTAIRAQPRIAGVARSLHLSPSTVRNHLSAVYRKLGVTSLAELLVALQEGGERGT